MTVDFTVLRITEAFNVSGLNIFIGNISFNSDGGGNGGNMMERQ